MPTYLQRTYFRHKETKYCFVREYIVKTTQTREKIFDPKDTQDAVALGQVTYNLTGKKFPKDWFSPFSTKSLKDAGLLK